MTHTDSKVETVVAEEIWIQEVKFDLATAAFDEICEKIVRIIKRFTKQGA